MLTRQEDQSATFSERELDLVEKVIQLREALRATLNYIEAGLQPVLPPNIERYRPLLEDVQPELEVESVAARELFDVVTAMARFLSLTTADEVFARYGLSGLADWTILMTLMFEPPGVTDRQITRIMGGNYKRIQRLTQSLAEAGLVSLKQVAANGTCAVEITETGQARVEEINAALEPVLRWFTQRQRFRLTFAARKIRLLARMYDERPVRKKKIPRPPGRKPPTDPQGQDEPL